VDNRVRNLLAVSAVDIAAVYSRDWVL